MSNQPVGRKGAAAVLIALLSVLVGGGIAFAAVSAVVSSSAPDDKTAVELAPETTIEPSEIINYGG